MIRLRSHWLLLLGILVLASLLRWTGIAHDVGEDGRMLGLWHLNETGLMRHVPKTFWFPLFDHEYWGYPALHLYLLAALDLLYFGLRMLLTLDLQGFYAFYQAHLPTFYLLARLVSWCASMATVAWIYVLGAQVTNRWVGLCAALLLAVSQQHVEHAHYATLDALLTLLCLGVVHFAHRLYRSGRWRDVVWAAVFSGLATAEKYNAFVTGFVPLVGCALSARCRSPRKMLVGAGLAAGVFFAINFYLFVNPAKVLFLFQENYQSVVHPEAASDSLRDGLADNLRILRSFGQRPACLLALLGVVFLLRRDPRRCLLLLSFPVVFLLLMSAFHLRISHYLLPLVPLVMLFAAHGIWGATFWLRPHTARQAACFLVAGLVAVSMLGETRRYLGVLRAPDTRQVATEWIDRNLPVGSRILVEGNCEYGPCLHEERFRLFNRMMHLGERWDTLEACRRDGIEYYVASEIMIMHFQDDADPPYAIYEDLLMDERVSLVRTFEAYTYTTTFFYFNPTIWVFRID